MTQKLEVIIIKIKNMKKKKIDIDVRVRAPINYISSKMEEGWGVQRIYNHLRDSEELKEVTGFVLFDVLMKEFGRRGTLFGEKEIRDSFNRLVPRDDWTEEAWEENISYSIELNKMYYDEYLEDTKKRV